jgi:hypothetical protein
MRGTVEVLDRTAAMPDTEVDDILASLIGDLDTADSLSKLEFDKMAPVALSSIITATIVFSC